MKPIRTYFFIADHVQKFDDSMIYLAEGLQSLGLPFYANRDFYKADVDAEYLFRHDPKVSFSDCDIVILSYTWFDYLDEESYQRFKQEPPDGLFNPGRQYKVVYLDPTDGYRTSSWGPYFRNFDLILRAKYNKRTMNPSNLRPWVLGYTDRITRATREHLPARQRSRSLLVNFNFSHPFEHQLRAEVKQTLLPKIGQWLPVNTRVTDKDTSAFTPYDHLMWKQTGSKHHPEYYRMLGSNLANACFCGELVPGLPFDPTPILRGGGKARMLRNLFGVLSRVLGKKRRIIQWDSWRFWETMLAGGVAVHIDLELYGVELPVMPVNWKHYIGFNLSQIDRDVKRMEALGDEILEIGARGRAWAIENYSPEASAKRLLTMLSK
ncbi:MAG: hypothetical protein K1X47_11385 [Cyclobacteriaceae bacterium]|nr:hypothetical protein [Cyclobacteriaceae bacterium]